MKRRGSQAVEFALLTPILLVLVAGITDYGVYLNQRVSVTMVARDAARAGSLVKVGGGDVAAQAEAQGDASLQVAGLPGNVNCLLTGGSPDQAVECTADVPFEPWIGLVSIPGSITANLTMRMEEQP